MDTKKKKELWEENFNNLKGGKKKVSALIASPKGFHLFNCGSELHCQNIKIIWGNGKTVRELCFDKGDIHQNIFPDKAMIFFWLKKGRVLVAEETDNDKEPTVYVGGYDEEDNEMTILLFAHISEGKIFQYYNRGMQTPFIRIIGDEYEEMLDNLYQGIKSLIVKEVNNESNDYERFFG